MPARCGYQRPASSGTVPALENPLSSPGPVPLGTLNAATTRHATYSSHIFRISKWSQTWLNVCSNHPDPTTDTYATPSGIDVRGGDCPTSC